MTDGDWAEHVPDGLIAMRADVWHCGDEVCDCSRARILGADRINSYGQRLWDVVLWTGTFRSGWPYEYDEAERAGGGPTTELNREARRLRKRHNALYHRIEWPWDRTRRVVEAQKLEEERAFVMAQKAADDAGRYGVARDLFIGSVQDLLGGER